MILTRIIGPIATSTLLLMSILIGIYQTIYYYILSFFPKWVGKRTLKKIIKNNKETVFGKHHRFKEIKNYELYIKHLKINEYEYFRPYIIDSIKSNKNHLCNTCIKAVTTTSGTTGKPKYIMVSKEVFKKDFFKSIIMLLILIFFKIPRALFNPVGVIVSGSDKKDSKLVFHSIANAWYRSSYLRFLFAIPPEIFEIENYEARYYYINLFCVIKRVRSLISFNPSTLIKIIDTGEKYRKELLIDIQSDILINRFYLKKAHHLLLNKIYKKSLSGIAFDRATQSIENLLPNNILFLMCWKSGNCEFFIPELEKRFGNKIKILDLGYYASDSPLTSHFGLKGSQLALMDRVFLEFIDITKEEGKPILYYQLQKGKKYKVIISNMYGLYRYDIHDIFEVTGFINKAPCLKFVQKTEGFSNIVGEKLSEDQVILVASNLRQELAYEIKLIIGIPDLSRVSYTFYLEISNLKINKTILDRLAHTIDQSLQKINIEYKQKRKSERLNRPVVKCLKEDAFERYKSYFIRLGIKETQFKIMCLHPDSKYEFLLEGMVK